MDTRFFSIGRITIALRYNSELYDIFLDRAMEQFEAEPFDSPDITFLTDAESPFPSLENYHLLFSTHPGGLWSIYEQPDSQGYAILLQNVQRDREPYKIVLTDRSFSNFHIHCRLEDRDWIPPLEYPLDELAISGHLNLNRIGIILHSACVSCNGKGYLFAGVSGSGKSTISEIWQKDPETMVLTDERVIIRDINGRLWAFGTPWHGTAEIHRNAGTPIDRIFFIRHGKKNRAVPLSRTEAVNRLMVRCFPTFWNRSGMQFVLDFCVRIASEIECYELEFVPDPSVVEYVKTL